MDEDVPAAEDLREHVRRHVGRYFLALVCAYTALGATAWVLVENVTAGAPLAGGLLGFVLVDRWRWWRRRREYLDEVAVAVALRTGSDPGPRLRPSAERRAREAIRESRGLTGVTVVVFGLPAAACVVTAVVRQDVVTALPLVPLVAMAAWALIRIRLTRTAAARWLADPPPPAADEGAA